MSHLKCESSGGFDLLEEVKGDTLAEVLSYVEHDPRRCMESFRKTVDAAISENRIDAGEGRTLIATYRDSLNGYTYYE